MVLDFECILIYDTTQHWGHAGKHFNFDCASQKSERVGKLINCRCNKICQSKMVKCCCSTDLTLAKRSKSAYHSAASGVLTRGGYERFQKTYGPSPWLRAPFSCLAGESSTTGDGLVQQVPALYRPRIYHCADSRSHRVPFRSGPDICKPFSHHAPCGLL